MDGYEFRKFSWFAFTASAIFIHCVHAKVDRNCCQVSVGGVLRVQWLGPTIRALLFALGAMPHFRLCLSADSAMGVPKDILQGIRVAWLQHDEAQSHRPWIWCFEFRSFVRSRRTDCRSANTRPSRGVRRASIARRAACAGIDLKGWPRAGRSF